MTDYPVMHKLGRIDLVTLEDTPALSRDVAFDLATMQTAWPEFEGAFDSLQGRKMMGLIYGHNGVYRMSSVRLDPDSDNTLGFNETVIPGGDYLRLRLTGAVPGIYGQIGPAFDVLFDRAGNDAERPHIEYYRREGEIDCLVPIHWTA